MAEAFLKMYFAVGLFSLAEAAVEVCLICAEANNRVTKKVDRGGRPWAVMSLLKMPSGFYQDVPSGKA